MLTLVEFFKLLFDLLGYFCIKEASKVKPMESNANEKEPEKNPST